MADRILFMFNFSVKIHAENFVSRLTLLAQNGLCDAIPATLKQKTLHCLDEQQQMELSHVRY